MIHVILGDIEGVIPKRKIFGAKIPDHTFCDQRLDDCITLGMGKADLTAAGGDLGAEAGAEHRARRLNGGDEPSDNAMPAGAHVIDTDTVPDIQSGFQRGHLDHRRCPDPHPFNSRTGSIRQIKRKRAL